jgi:hypothetical protein
MSNLLGYTEVIARARALPNYDTEIAMRVTSAKITEITEIAIMTKLICHQVKGSPIVYIAVS